MRVPEFLKEVIRSFYAPSYKHLARRPFLQSLKYMSKTLLIAVAISSLFFIPQILLIGGSIERQLSNFESLTLSANASQASALIVPSRNPWIIVDLANNRTLSEELLVIDANKVQYRMFKIKEIPRAQFKNPTEHSKNIASVVRNLAILLAPGIALLIYIRLWLKYLLMIIAMGTLFFILLDLTRYKHKYKEMLSIAAHAITPVIFIELISAPLTAIHLLPVGKFLGLNIYLTSIILFAGMMIYGIVGSFLPGKEKQKDKSE
ncbi:DUF1189 domain-containing protein [Candidatus Woesearchaeota archaeon]|nr:MAG: DUF1189 domain-containing protein [Candidatus Woesearchaeota archaeon]